MDLNGLTMGAVAAAPGEENKEKQAEHSATPTASTGEGANAKTVALSLAGFMGIFYLLYVLERWAKKI